jgi:selenocysteine lyase/cysteine desulfurase
MKVKRGGLMRDDLARWRQDTPGTQTRNHLNNAGSALMPTPVADAILEHLALEREIGGYEAADFVAERITEVYARIAMLVGAAPRNIAIVENATVAFSQAIAAFDFAPGDRIVVSRADYVSHQLMFIAMARRQGVEVVHAEDTPSGGVDPDSVRQLASHPRCRLVSVSWMPTNSGLVQDVAAVGEVCAALGIPFIVDACQAVGQQPIDVSAIGCDFLAATARKFLRGPRGIGFLYVSDRALDRQSYPITIDMQGANWTGVDSFELVDSARRFENWEFPYALVLGLGEAARYALDVGVDIASARAWRLAAQLRTALHGVPGARVLDRGDRCSAIVTVAFAGVDHPRLVRQLRERNVNTSAASRTTAWLDMTAKGVESALRVSPHYYNTEDELDAFVEIVKALSINSLRDTFLHRE